MKKITRYTNPKVIGVTGGMGSGQSTVCKILKSLGARVIDVDNKAKQVIKKDRNVQKELIRAFGQEIFDKSGELNRPLLASRAFSDDGKTLILNKIVHPRMVSEIVEEMETARFSQKYPLIALDAALIFEINLEKMFDTIIVVYADLEKRISRVMGRDAQDRSQIMSRVKRQIPLETKRKWADYVIDNNDSIEKLEERTKQVFNELTRKLEVNKRIRV